jgi:hypothetical protein
MELPAMTGEITDSSADKHYSNMKALHQDLSGAELIT